MPRSTKKGKTSRSRQWKKKTFKPSRGLSLLSRSHLFKRLGVKTIVFINGIGSVSSQGSPSTDSGFSLSSVSSDALTGCYQFGWVHDFRMINVVQYNEFTNLFDRYKIVGINYKVMYQCNDAQVQGSQVLPIVHYAIDYDDATVPSVLTDISSKSNCRTKVLGNTQYVVQKIKPKVAGQIYQSAIATGYSVIKAPYINSTYSTVPHYGIKFWLNNVYMSSSNNTAITIEPEYIFACKDVN